MALKAACGLFVTYYCLISVVFPSTAILLTPMCGLMLASVIIYVIHNNQFMLNDITFPIGCWILFIFISFISSYFIAIDLPLALNSAFTFLKLIVMCFCVVYISKETDNYEYLINIMFVISLLYVFYMLYMGNYKGTRLTIGNANSDANVCLIGIVTGSLILVKRKNPLLNLLVFCAIGLMAYVNLMTGSRKSFACLCFYVVGWIFIELRIIWKEGNANARIKVFLLFALCALIIEFILLPIVSKSNTFSRIMSDSAAVENELRVDLYREAWELFLKSPLFGVGYNQFRVYNSSGIYSHSTYGEILSNCGIVGCLLFFMPHIWCIKSLCEIIALKRKKLQDQKNTLLVFAYFISTLILATGMVQTNNEWILLMYSLVFSYIICEKERIDNGGKNLGNQRIHNARIWRYIR